MYSLLCLFKVISILLAVYTVHIECSTYMQAINAKCERKLARHAILVQCKRVVLHMRGWHDYHEGSSQSKMMIAMSLSSLCSAFLCTFSLLYIVNTRQCICRVPWSRQRVTQRVNLLSYISFLQQGLTVAMTTRASMTLKPLWRQLAPNYVRAT